MAIIWAKLTGGITLPLGNGNRLAVTSTNDVFIIGNFKNTIDFDPGAGTFHLTAASSDESIFVQKLDANGNFLWAAATGGPSNTEAHLYGVAIDPSDNLYLTGNYQNFVNFGFRSGALYPSLPSGSQSRVFVLKMNDNGQPVWLKSMGNTWSQSYDIAVDEKRSVYTIGKPGLASASPWAYDFDPGSNTHIPSDIGAPMYLHKLDSNGNFKWMELYDGANGEIKEVPDISIDADENILVTGSFVDTIDFDLNPNITVRLGAHPGGEQVVIFLYRS